VQSSASTHEEFSQHYTTAIDACCKIAQAYFYLGRLADAQYVLRSALHLVETGEAKPQVSFSLNIRPPTGMAVASHRTTFDKVVDEMRLVEIPAGELEVCPPGGLPSGGPAQRLLKAKQAAKHFWRESDGFLEQLDEALRVQAQLRSHLRDGALLVSGLE
jgi:hypothetical protein